MNKRQLRAFAVRDPKAFRQFIHGARARELAARHLLLHPHQVTSASPEDLAALKDYVKDRGWGSLYGHDRRMYKLLRAGAEKLQGVLGHLYSDKSRPTKSG
jgi:hypothetical protein